MNAIEPEAIAESLELLMLHRAYRATPELSKTDPGLYKSLRGTALATERMMRVMGSDIGHFYDLCFEAAGKIDCIGVDTTIVWSYDMLHDSLFGKFPLPGFVIVDATLKNGERVQTRVDDLKWDTSPANGGVERYRIANHRDNFWYEKNRKAYFGSPEYEQPWPKVPMRGQRVRIRYDGITKNPSTNTHVYWLDGWVNWMEQEMYNVTAWQPLTEAEARETVQRPMFRVAE